MTWPFAQIAPSENPLAEGEKLLDHALEFLSTRGLDFLLRGIAAILIFLIGRWLARVLSAGFRKAFTAAKIEATLARFLANLIHAALVVFAAIAAMGRLGIDTTSFAAVVAAAGLAVGLALQGSLSNFAAGVLIVILKPFKVGDIVEAAGNLGVVQGIDVFNTTILTPDNVTIIVPNGQVTGAVIKNLSAEPMRRVDMRFSCAYEDDLAGVKQLLIDVLRQDARVLADPPPVVAVAAFEASGIAFNVRPWVKTPDYWPVFSDIHEKVKLRFDEKGYTIPYPVQNLRFATPVALGFGKKEGSGGAGPAPKPWRVPPQTSQDLSPKDP